MKFTLPISPNYCEHWGLWEAVREIYQNALDEGGATLEYDEDMQHLFISSDTGRLTPESLVLGTTSKRANLKQRGKFGEGYKLALVVLARLEKRTTIHTGCEIWTPALEHDTKFNATVLTIHTEEAFSSDRIGVMFIVRGITPKEYSLIYANVRPDPEEPNTILDEPAQKGRLYVGGLYVATVKKFQCGYSFRPGVVKLDRDRGMVEDFNLAWQTSQLWIEAGHSERVSELMEAEAPDVEYVESHVAEGSKFADEHLNHFFFRHGKHAVPVSSQDEIQRATAAGMKWVLVPEKVKAILRRVKSWFIPSSEATIDRLKRFRDTNQWYLTNNGRQELDEIIQSLEPRSEHVETHATN